MKRLRQNITTYYLGALTLVFLITPVLVFAADGDASASFAQRMVWGVLIGLTGMLLRIGGIVFDYGINTFVIGFGKLYATSGVGFAVDNAWVTIRDFVNLFFIFGLVYIGIKLILDSNDSNTRRWLVNLVIAALLINFSLFITKFVVDFSNQLSYQIAQGAGWYVGENNYTQEDVTMSEKILTYMGVTEVFNLSGNGLNNASWGYIFGTAIFFTITAFILMAGGFLLIVRFAMLNLFLVMSPLMFLSWVLPPLNDTMQRYWKGFIGRAFFAPVYFLFMYFSLEILKGFQTYIQASGGGRGLGNAGSNVANTFAGENGRQVLESTQSTMPFFFLICIFMIASLVIASKMGADFGDKAVGLGRSLSNKAGNYAKRGAIGTGKYATAQTAGRTARYASDKLGSGIESGLRRTQQLQGNGKLARATRWAARTNFVEGTVGGAASSLQKTKFGMSRTREEDKKMRTQTDKRANNAMAVTSGLEAQKLLDAIKSGKIKINNHGIEQEHDLATMTDAMKKQLGLDASEADLQERVKKAEQTIGDFGVKDIETLSEEQQILAAQFLSGSQTDAALKSDNISDKQKSKIKEAQKEAIEKMLYENGELITDKLTSLSTRQIETLGEELITKFAADFSDSQFADLKKSKVFTETQTSRFIGARKSGFNSKINGGVRDVESLFEATSYDTGSRAVNRKVRKATDIARLPADVLTSPKALPYITIDVLKAVSSTDKDFERLNTAQREQIRTNIENRVRTAPAGSPAKAQAEKALGYLTSIAGQRNFFGEI